MLKENAALERLALADDFAIVQVFQVYHDNLLSLSGTDKADVLAGVPEELQSVDGEIVADDFEARANQALPQGLTIRVARQLMTLAAQDAVLSQVVLQSFEDWRDDRQMVAEVLAIGLVGAVWICLASTTFRLRLGDDSYLEKKNTTANQLRGLAEVIRAIRGLGEGDDP